MGTFSFKVGQGDPVILTTGGETPPKLERRIAIERAKRNSLLAKSDNKIVTDRGMSESKITEWKAYRQALRDMDFSDPDNLNWPNKPE
tara:strand:+ start:3953 stop:4216 length:264 start_codon:yes stop_codon:yes gene_type:complete